MAHLVVDVGTEGELGDASKKSQEPENQEEQLVEASVERSPLLALEARHLCVKWSRKEKEMPKMQEGRGWEMVGRRVGGRDRYILLRTSKYFGRNSDGVRVKARNQLRMPQRCEP